jgi:endonuclease/exonuclease/phosphatase family metal-dependent hydrolase
MSVLIRLISLCGLAAALFCCSANDGPKPDGPMVDSGAVDSTPQPDLQPDFPAGPPFKLSIASFNVQNYFDADDDPTKSDELPKASEVTDKTKAIGAAIRAINADVIALQEVENLELLQRLVKDELASMGYEHIKLLEGNDPRGIDVALLSRFKVLTVTSHASDRFPGTTAGDTDTYRFSRDCLEVVIEPQQDRRLILLVNHLRATDWRDPDLSLRIRQAQARRVREIVDSTLEWEPTAYLAVVGDLNDTPDSLALGEILQGTPKLVDPFAGQSIDRSYTSSYKGNRSRIDYILLSPGLAREVNRAETRHDSLYKRASDHYPPRVELTIR